MEKSKDEPWRNLWGKTEICEEKLEPTRTNKNMCLSHPFNFVDVSELQAKLETFSMKL